jgi:3-oxoacid CoA-transferase
MTAGGLTNAEEAVSRVRTGDTVMVGGFGLVGAPLTLIDALVEHSDATKLTIVSNNIGEPGRGLGKLLRQGRIKRGISSYFTSNPEAVAAVNEGRLEATLMPQGTFAEAIRAGGAGIGGFFTPVGAGTLLADGKEERSIDGVAHVLEAPLVADIALVYAARADMLGNLWYRRTDRRGRRSRRDRRARARVDRHAAPLRRPPGSASMTDARLRIARRAAKELRRNEIVNLGIGIPNLIPGLLADDAGVFLQTENGLLGVGPRPSEDEVDPDLIDAAKQPITALPGASYFDSASSFAMIRGGHVDVAVLGALQVSARGDIANWAIPGKDVLGVGGAMDLVVGARRVIVTMTATSSSGEPKVVAECTHPLTAREAADVIVTELSVFRIRDGHLYLTELADGVSVDDVSAVTSAPFTVDLEVVNA